MPLFPNSHLSLESVLVVLSGIAKKGDCKVMIYKDVVCWLLFRTKFDCNLFNLLYPVFVVRFDCKGCVLKKESVKT